MMIFLLLFFCMNVAAGDLPNPAYTPGAVDASKTRSVLCSPSYRTGSVRPPDSYTNALKSYQLRNYYKGNSANAEEDHLVSLQLGGDPRSEKNLWPEPYNSPHGAKIKDACEDRLHALVCRGSITLPDAQAGISGNWITYCRGK